MFGRQKRAYYTLKSTPKKNQQQHTQSLNWMECENEEKKVYDLIKIELNEMM